ncbi:MAG TPA: cupin domain-containing protein [Gaiellaceae bacterium]|nr:cupin domain-containing protein [Gaiellaceae bacterium]
MQHWKLYEIETPDGARSPVVLHSADGESRVVLIALDPEQELRDHEVKEAALLLVVSGEARIESGGDAILGRAGDLFRFDPEERHAVSTEGGARLLLTLAPWPGRGHYRGEERAGATAS